VSDAEALGFLPPRHPAHRIGDALRGELIRAQRSIIDRAFANAAEFCERVVADLRIAIDVPARLAAEPVEAVANLPFAELQELFAAMLAEAGTPESGIALTATNLARRAQLLRAFDDPDAVLQWATAKVMAIVAHLPKSAREIECGRKPGDVLHPPSSSDASAAMRRRLPQRDRCDRYAQGFDDS
jgi:hypothetical protein